MSNFCGNSDSIKFIVVEPTQSITITGDTFVTGFTYSNGNLTILQNQGQLPLSVNLPIHNGNRWYIPSGVTVTVTPGFQYFVYGDMYIDGTLELELDSQLVVLNGDLILSSTGTVIGLGTPYLITLPDTQISNVTYNNDVLTITETNGDIFTVTIPTFSGNTSGNCITDLYVSNLNSCSPLHIQPVNTGDVYISENGGNVGIGTSSPSELLDVNGKIKTTNFQMTSGATNGYVLSSDFLGNAMWIPGSSISGVTSVDTFVTGFTFNNTTYDLTISQNEGQPNKTINLGILAQDVNVTGGTYNPSNGVATFYNNIGGSFNVSGFITGFTDIHLSAVTYNTSTGVLKLTETDGTQFSVSGLKFTGNTSGDCITDIYTSNIHSCSPLHINPLDEGNVYFGSTSGITIDLSNKRIGVGTSTPTEKLEVSGKIKTTNFQMTSGATNGYVLSSDSLGNAIWIPGSSISGITDTFVTGFTYSNNNLTINRNQGQSPLTVNVSVMTGLTVNGGLTVTGNTSVKDITGTSAVFSGTGSNILTVIGSGTTSPIFKVQGSSGELFSITDSLTGSLFSVNDISGLPILEAFSDNTILMGSYLAPSLNTTTKVTANAGVTPIYYIPTSAYTGSFYDYTVMSSVGARSGNIMSIWSGTSVNYTETTTTSIGDTSGITFSVSLSGSTAMLSTSANTNSWTVKTIIRSI